MSDTKRPSYFLRPSAERGAPMQAVFELEGVKSVLYLNSIGELAIHKLGRNSRPNKKPIAQGQAVQNPDQGEDYPDLVGLVTTAKGTVFELAFWFHDDPIRPYYVVRYSKRPVPQGSVYRPESIAA